MMPRPLGTILLAMLVLLAPSAPALAQNWSWDARTDGMGGVGDTGNLATKMIDEQRNYTAIVIPLGVVQGLSDTGIYNPNSTSFDPIRVAEYAASPYAYVIGRTSSNSGEALFVSDVRNATLSPNLAR